MHLQLRVFRALLRLFPEPFRDAYGEEMTAFFADQITRARSSGTPGVLRLWISTALDLLPSAAAERARPTVRLPFKPQGEPMSAFLYDLRHAARRLLHAPAFTLPALLILALGIGLNATVFNLADTLLYRSGPFANPDRLVHVYQDGTTASPARRPSLPIETSPSTRSSAAWRRRPTTARSGSVRMDHRTSR